MDYKRTANGNIQAGADGHPIVVFDSRESFCDNRLSYRQEESVNLLNMMKKIILLKNEIKRLRESALKN